MFDHHCKKIALLGLNSALMCGRRRNEENKIDERGFLVVGEPQIHDALRQVMGADVRIALMHHPFSWLTEFDRNTTKSRVCEVMNIVLHGHEHMPEVESTRGSAGDRIVVSGGASYDRRRPNDPRYRSAYNFVHLDLESGLGTVYLRRWNDSRSRWDADSDTYPSGTFPFSLDTLKVPISRGSTVPPQ